MTREIPVSHAFDLAYDIDRRAAAHSTGCWINIEVTESFGAASADNVERTMSSHSTLDAPSSHNIGSTWVESTLDGYGRTPSTSKEDMGLRTP